VATPEDQYKVEQFGEFLKWRARAKVAVIIGGVCGALAVVIIAALIITGIDTRQQVQQSREFDPCVELSIAIDDKDVRKVTQLTPECNDFLKGLGEPGIFPRQTACYIVSLAGLSPRACEAAAARSGGPGAPGASASSGGDAQPTPSASQPAAPGDPGSPIAGPPAPDPGTPGGPSGPPAPEPPPPPGGNGGGSGVGDAVDGVLDDVCTVTEQLLGVCL